MTTKIAAPTIAICEDTETYKFSMRITDHCDLGEDKWRLSLRHKVDAHLYQVVLSDKSIHYCIAESETAAIGQVACRPADEQTWEEQQNLQKGAIAIQLPLVIRGWGKNRF